MEFIIKVKDICKYAMFETDGEVLRKKVLDVLKRSPENTVVLDFEGISMFATMFFNASIGWILLHEKSELISSRISTRNLSELGEETWRHSYENAIEIAKNPEYIRILESYNPDEDNEG